jgi:predicted GH43/DUF377 family glycosyl hydrolase
MKWKKLGVVYVPDGSLPWARSHATCPTPIVLGDRIRVYVQCRDEANVGRIGFVDLDVADPRRVVYVHPDPVLDIGRPGTFDENGVFQTCVLPIDSERIFLYYVGFELGTKIRYRLLTGLAVSRDGGLTFERVRKTPILERSDEELYVRGGPWVLRKGGRFRMWYVAGSEWTEICGKQVPVYDIRYFESDDGVSWPEHGPPCIQVETPDEVGFGRPYVVPHEGGLRMFYSVRLRSLGGNYTVGVADSQDGKTWARQDASLGLFCGPEDWDSKHLDYLAPVEVNGRTYLFYNGNDFGLTGFGVAELVSIADPR